MEGTHRIAASGTPRLTRREHEALVLAACGLPCGETAAAMGISQSTVKMYRRQCARKLATHTIAQAVAVAFVLGLVSRRELGEAMVKHL